MLGLGCNNASVAWGVAEGRVAGVPSANAPAAEPALCF